MAGKEHNNETIVALEMLLELFDEEVARQYGESGLEDPALQALRQTICNFKSPLITLFGKGEQNASTAAERAPRAYYGNAAKRGIKTPEADFQLPILQVLVELGGQGRKRDVMKAVGRVMKDQLHAWDKKRLPSNTGHSETRWQNTCAWARNTMVHEQGLLMQDSPRGIWQISEQGRKYLRTHQPLAT